MQPRSYLRTLKNDRLTLLVSAVFLVVGAFVIAHHELWRDEVQAWLLARDSSSAIDLFSRQKYEGHPALRQLLLMPLTRALSRPSGQHILLVLSHGLDEGLVRDNQMKKVGAFDGAVVPDENFHRYLLD
jgi:hypothetical protein